MAVASNTGFGIASRADRFEDLEGKIKEFLIGLLKKAAAKSGNKVDDKLVEALEKALLGS